VFGRAPLWVRALRTFTLPMEVVMPVWAWILIIVLIVLLLSGGIYVRR
jgi:hypothetical protein